MLGYTPAHLELYVQAFKHKSNSVEVNGHRQHNERLEFLGDAILNSIVAEYLYKKYPNGDEGFLTKMRSKIVKRKTLDAIGARMGIDDLMTIMNKTQISRSMLGNALEALVGAVYLENGYAFTRKFIVLEILRKYLDIHRLEGMDDNFKSQLLEWCQKNNMEVNYELVSKYKFEKRDRFKIAVMIQGEQVAEADDFNKKNAEQIASEKAMMKLGILSLEDAETSLL
ncbi:MAG TPA: ribonuclease III [Saprospiraceae bacterium]|jgi:ribonuclease-3|nr:ribonuclease III [Candidatus Parvibacillus calidus]MBX2935641.1 ribonuclease III [Saprospiraceae bacterium]MBX7178674.1 ribonuclease III [Saprospiraceae bacterium]MCB0590733.1 ribonuclease III [Saprospiraceae bacterium]MCC7148019.1 ribonuclease III [Saprospiraceae bacterium]